MANINKPFAGQLDRRITVIYEELLKNSIGEEKPERRVLCRPWAKLDEVGGGEEVEGKVLHRTGRSFIVRFRQEIKQKNNQLFVDYEGVIYNVTHIKEIGRKEFLELQCVVYE